MVTQRADLTFKYNRQRGRHGWVRLTPAYSIKVVQMLLDENPRVAHVLDPFAGTGTTGLVCAANGVPCDLVDINPFLAWLGRVKTASYTPEQLRTARAQAAAVTQRATEVSLHDLWVPPISNINRWWSQPRLLVIARLFHALEIQSVPDEAIYNLLLVAFCRVVIKWSNAAFNHQSVSFKDDEQLLIAYDETDEILRSYLTELDGVLQAAHQQLRVPVNVFIGDARAVAQVTTRQYDCVITSPPYPNRMSYIRELRPYMYWLGYLQEAHEAGDLDWQAIGGTWGSATSRLKEWQPPATDRLPALLLDTVAAIALDSPLLANYVHKYFSDMRQHLRSLRGVLRPGAHLFYVIGNSKFYDTLVSAEVFYADMMAELGYVEITSEIIRKRNSKKELFEYLISARMPA